MQRVLDEAMRARRAVGLVYLDVDRFHLINARWGRVAGDAILAHIGGRLEARLPSKDSIAVADGAAFVVVLVDVGAEAVARIAAELLAAVRQPIAVGAENVEVAASAGYAFTDSDDVDIDLFERAFLACRSAKLSARGTALAYADQFHADAERSRRYEDGLRRAIAGDHLVLQFQPVIDLRDGRITAVEALVRWEHPDEGWLLPDQFLPVAESVGMMIEIGDWVLERAISLIGAWGRSLGSAAPQVWINLAAAQVAAGDHVLDIVQRHLTSGVLRAEQIGFEVTESTVLADLPEASRLLGELRGLGIEISLDDFGTGYSSLSYLRQLPVTAVKVDREFIVGIADSLADEAIVEAVIDLAHALGLRVVAEGVEDADQHAALVRMGADEAQGFYFAAPCTIDNLEPLLGDWPWSGGADAKVAASMPGFGSPRSRLLLTALDTAHGAIMVTAANGTADPTIVYVNAAFETETGYRARDVIGQRLDVVVGGVDDHDRAWLSDVLVGHESSTREMRFPRQGGPALISELALSPIFDQRGVHTHWLHLLRDLSETRRRARLADFAARIARRTLDDDRVELFRRQFEILEPLAELFDADLAYLDLIDLDQGTLTPLGDWTLRPEDRSVRQADLSIDEFPAWIERLSSMDVAMGSINEEMGAPWALEIIEHFGLKPGHNVYLPLRVGSTLLGVLGFNTFRTDHRFEDFEVATMRQLSSTLASLLWRLRSDEAIRRSNARLAAMMANVSEVVIAVDTDGVIGWASDALRRVFGLDQDAVVGSDFRRFVDPAYLDSVESMFQQVTSGDGQPLSLIAQLARPGGAPIWIEMRSSGQFDEQLGGYTVTLRDVDNLRGKVEQADRIVVFDEIGSGIGEWALNLMDISQLVDGLRHQLTLIGEALGCSAVSLERFGGSLIGPPVEWGDPTAANDATLDVHRQPMSVLGQQIGEITARRGHRPGGWQADEFVLLRRASLSLAALIRRLEMLTENTEVEQWMAAVLDETNELMVVIDGSATIRSVNGAVTRLLGYAPAELVGRNIADAIHPADVEVAMARVAVMFDANQKLNTTLRVIASDGQPGWWEFSRGAPLGNLGGRVVLCRQVSSPASGELIESRRVARLQYAVNLSQTALDLDADEFIDSLDGVCVALCAELEVDGGVIIHFDPEGDALVLARSGVIGDGETRVGAAEEFVEFRRALGEKETLVITDASTVEASWMAEQVRFTGPATASLTIPMIVSGAPIGALAVTMAATRRDWTVDDATHLRMVSETIAHVVERSRVVEALRASEAKFRLLSDAAADVVLLVDADRVIRYASPSSSRLLGEHADALVGTPLDRLADPEHPDLLTVREWGLDSNAATVEGRLRRPDGGTVWVSNSASRVVGPENTTLPGVRMSLRDISERKRLEAELEWRATHDSLTGLLNGSVLLQS